jgi:hypothetical protein
MARIQQYKTDTTITGGDKLVGNDAADNSTKLFQISDIAAFFAKEGIADGAKIGYQFNYGGKYANSAIDSGSIEYDVNPTAPSQFSWANIDKIAVSTESANSADISNVLPFMVNQNIKVTDILNDTVDNFAVFNVTGITDIQGGKLLSITMKASSGNPTAANIVLAPFGFISAADLNALTPDDIVNNLLSTDDTKVLSASQGKILKDLVDLINAAIASDDPSLDTLQEVVDYIKANNASIASLNTTMATKEDKVAGKGLSTEDFTSNLLAKLNSIATNAEVNVQSNWSQSNSANDAFIQNKPTDLTDLSVHSVTELNDVTNAGSGEIITSGERTKLTGIAAGAEVNVQANYNETDNTSDAFIQNKPTITVAGTSNEVEVSPTGAQNLPTTFTVGLPNDVTINSDLTVGDSIQLSNAQSSTPTFDNGIYFSTENSSDVLHFRYDDKDLSIDYLTEILSTGILNGGELSVANGTQFTIAAGDGIINDINKASGSAPHPEIKKISWSQQTITVSNLDSGNTEQLNSWVYVDANGAVQQQATAFTDAQKRNNITIGSAIHTEGVLKFVKTFPITAYDNTAQINEFANIFGPLKKSGHKVSANGANLSINRAAGVAFALGRNYTADPENPSTVSDSAKTQCVIHRYYRNNSGGFVLDDGPSGNGYTVLDPTKYDNGSGTLQTVSGGNFAVQRLFYFPGTPNIIVSYYGHDTYASLIDAEKEYTLEDFLEAENTSDQAIYLGAIILRGNATAINDTAQAKILTAGAFRGLASVDLGGVSASASLGDLQDVNISSVNNDQVIRYNSSNGRWENQTLPSGGITGSGTANKIAKFSGTSAVADSIITESSGNIGIGATSPSAKLEIKGTGTTNTLAFKTTDASSNETFYIKDGGAAGVRYFPFKIGVPSGTTNVTNSRFQIATTAGDFIVLNDGKTGIGTTSPSEKLEVIGNVRADVSNGGGFMLTGASTSGLVRNNATGVALRTNTTDRLIIDSAGNVGIGTASPDFLLTLEGSTTTPALKIKDTTNGVTLLAFSQDANSHIGTYSNHPLVFDTNSAEAMRIDSAGKVGIGTVSPSVSLDINDTDAIKVPVGTTAQRPTAANGMLRYSTTDNQFEGYADGAWGAIAGGGGGSSAIERNTFSGNGSTTQFTLTSPITDEVNTQVYVDGVYQSKLNYSSAGNVITFSSAPHAGTDNIEVINVKAVTVSGASAMNKNTFTGDGSATSFTLGSNPTSEDFTFVFIQGVYQEKSTYVVANNIITFSTAPQNGYTIEVMHMGAVNVQQSSYMEYDAFTGTGSQTAFTLVNGNPTDEKFTMVFLQGVYQEKSTYSLSNRVITFTTAPDNNYTIEIMSVNSGGLLTVPSHKPTVGVISSDTTAVANSVYVLTANLTLTLPANPQIGDSIKVSNRSGVATCVLGANNKKIMGAAANLTLDTASASFELIYSGTNQGWVIIGQ